jgi:hypothetical protein
MLKKMFVGSALITISRWVRVREKGGITVIPNECEESPEVSTETSSQTERDSSSG